MLKTHKETETREFTVIDDVVCNKCGHSIRTVPHNSGMGHDSVTTMEWVSIQKSWGYCSKKDMSSQSADLCEPCWDAFCDTFAVPVTWTAYGEDAYAEEDRQLPLFTQDEYSGEYEFSEPSTPFPADLLAALARIDVEDSE